MFLSLIYGATEKVIITSPYFVPDEAMVYAITTACQRGLEVQLFVSEQADQWLVGHAQRSYYSDLLEAGVRIFMYPAPYILHAKHMSIDDDIAVHRLEQHGHPLVQPQRGVLAPGARRVLRREACARSSRATATPAAS